MSTRSEQIVRQVDEVGPPAILPPEQAAQAAAHKAVRSLLKQAYTFEPSDASLAFLGERVMARARVEEPRRFTAWLHDAWRVLSFHPALSLSGAALALTIIVAAGMFSLHKPVPQHSQPARMRSFVIYQMPDGSGFIKCFEYESASGNPDANESS